MSTTTKHTPGPWESEKYGLNDPSFSIVHDNRCIADLTCPRRNGDGANVPRQIEAKANARLISAAPEMLELLRECAECLPRHTPIWADVHALIARIEGQQ